MKLIIINYISYIIIIYVNFSHISFNNNLIKNFMNKLNVNIDMW